MNGKVTKTILILLTLFTTLFSQGNQKMFNWQIGEELTYKVSYGFIRLGTLRLSIVDTVNIDGIKTYRTRLKIDSNPWLFFIDMHSRFESYLMADTFTRLFTGEENIDGENYNSRYDFNYDKQELRVQYEGVENKDKTINKTIPLKKKLQDGMSIIFYARANCERKSKEELNVFYELQEGLLEINFSGKTDAVDVLCLKKKVSTFYLNGNADFKAIAGFGGEYEGWFSTDKQHVPLAARMEVFVGSVYLELEEYKNWHTY